MRTLSAPVTPAIVIALFIFCYNYEGLTPFKSPVRIVVPFVEAFFKAPVS
jgi:hypothetical protein